MSTIFLFPGQGSQKPRMGEGLFERYPEWTGCASDILGYSIRRLCLEDPDKQLNMTTHTQPALYVVNAMTYRARLEEVAPPDRVAGHSLGEFNALLAAGAFDFATGLKLVRQRAALMGRERGGAMAAVVGLTVASIDAVLSGSGFHSLDVANYNTPLQTVLSGPEEDILRARFAFEAAGARIYLRLNVSGAFHSRYMAGARAGFADFLAPFAFGPLRIPVVANCDAEPYREGAVAANLARQLTSSVQWTRTLESFFSLDNPRFEEIGPSNVLTGLLSHMSASMERQ
ncbi:MAG TPA: ACP S-malonyltransferase [Fibrobacteria bacterium]|nr:ACP S-malonyltransferase [Fibrobacteria bacterium]